MCNKSTSTASVAFAYLDVPDPIKDIFGTTIPQPSRGWNSEGWYNLQSGECTQVYPHELRVRNSFYYVYAKSNDGTWGGNKNFCVVEGSKFGLANADKNCGGNGTFVGFNEVNTGDSRNYTYRLTESTPRQSPNASSNYIIDPLYYSNQYADLAKAFGSNQQALIKHWEEYGIKECRRSSPVFDVSYYLQSYPDLQNAFGAKNCAEGVKHWERYGIREGRQGHPDFSAKCYLDRYPDLQNAFGDKNYSAAINHYFQYGRNENRNGKC